jgi:DNA adenine methylase
MLDAYAAYFFPNTPPTRFIDLFAGGLTMSLWIGERYPSCEIVVNDANPELILLYRTLAIRPDDVIASWQTCVDGWLTREAAERKPYYYTLRDTYCHDYTSRSDAELSGLLLFMLSVNFNGMWKAYNKCNKRYSTPPGNCNQSNNFFVSSNIYTVAQFLRDRCTIVCGSYADTPIRGGDFVYADPPYRDSSVDYQCGFTDVHQIDLAQFLMRHQGLFAYSNKHTNDGFYKQHFPDAHVYEIGATYTAGRGGAIDVTEVLITNYEPALPEATLV